MGSIVSHNYDKILDHNDVSKEIDKFLSQNQPPNLKQKINKMVN